jgi:hypothetical protein
VCSAAHAWYEVRGLLGELGLRDVSAGAV